MHPALQAVQKAGRRSFSAAAGVILLIVGAAAATAGLVLTLPNGTALDLDHLPEIVALAAAFAISEHVTFHIEARSEAISYAPTEIALAVGLVFVSPLELLVARLTGALVGRSLKRRAPVLKLTFNLANFAFETAVAAWLLRALSTPFDGVMASAATMLVALFAALVLGGIGVALAISQYEGAAGARVRREIVNAPIFYLPPALIATSIAVSMVVNPWLGLVAAGPVPVVWFVIRSHGALMHRYSDLTSVHDFSRVVGDATDLGDIGAAAAERISANSRAAKIALRLWDADGDPIDTTIGRIDTTMLPRESSDIVWAPLLARRSAVRVDAATPGSPMVDLLRSSGIEHCLVGAVADERGPLGVMVVTDRRGAHAEFDDDDLDRLRAMAQQLAIVARKARFHSQIQYAATHDRLTNLPNRSYFEGWIDQTSDTDHERALLLIDLDRFKEINDAFGHHAGDAVLIETARRISALCGPVDLPSRFGGDEFAVLARGVDAAEAGQLAERISRALEDPYNIGPATVAIGASIGIAVSPIHARDATGLLRRADVAMYDAKNRHVRFTVYRDDLEENDASRLMLLSDLRGTLQQKGLDVHYQPQVDLRTGEVIGAEALARWHHPEHGFVSPELFVGLAEQSGLIEELTRQVITKATRAAAAWQKRGWDLAISVNVSAQSLLDERLEPLVALALYESGLEPERLMLEITETTMMGDPARTHRILQGLATLGVRLSVDDFGTGYSSLSNLRHFPVSELKIDRSFIIDLMNDLTDDVIVRSTIELGHNLGLQVVAEGVENDEVSRRLVDLECDIGQGYGIARPACLEDFEAWIRERAPSPALESRVV